MGFWLFLVWVLGLAAGCLAARLGWLLMHGALVGAFGIGGCSTISVGFTFHVALVGLGVCWFRLFGWLSVWVAFGWVGGCSRARTGPRASGAACGAGLGSDGG